MAEESERGPQSQEEFLRQLEAEMRRLTVSDFLVQTAATLASLGSQRLSGEGRDLAQARLAIDAIKALSPVIGGSVSETARRDLDAAIASMQLAFARAVSETTAPTTREEPAEPSPPSDESTA